MKRIIVKMLALFISLALALVSAGLFAEAAYSGEVSAKAAVLLCADTGEILYSKNPNTRLSMASTTKIMTALLAVEASTPELNIVVSEEMVTVEGSSMGLLPGDSVTLRNLVYGMLLESGNDAASVAAYVLGDTLEGFAGMMNAKAEEIGMKNTNFVTPSGLDANDHYSTAYDMAILAQYAIKNPEFAMICAQDSARISYGNPPYMRTVSNHNRLLDEYEGCFGVKTGYTKKSGRCLVSAAERGGVTLICVTLSAPDDWNDHKKLFDYGFETVKSTELPSNYSSLRLNIVGGVEASVTVEPAYKPRVVFSGALPEIYNVVYIKPFEYAPVEKGSVIGYSIYYANGQIVDEVPLVAAADVAAIVNDIEKKPSLWEKIKSFFDK